MGQAIYECPFCDTPAWRSRMMLWMHMHDCIRKNVQFDPMVGTSAVNIGKNDLPVFATG